MQCYAQYLSNKLHFKNSSKSNRMAGVGPAKTIQMRKIKLILSEQNKMKKIFTKSCRVSLFKVVIACCEVNIKLLSLFIRKRFSMATVKSDQQWSIDSREQNQTDELNV